MNAQLPTFQVLEPIRQVREVRDRIVDMSNPVAFANALEPYGSWIPRLAQFRSVAAITPGVGLIDVITADRARKLLRPGPKVGVRAYRSARSRVCRQGSRTGGGNGRPIK